ncbi:Sec7-domain-containing protein [Neoconidiobolus thromboides FSU 785]|nr:Sec7-domain-containing protein [Neoconidiobolus thromboides FSU 785]
MESPEDNETIVVPKDDQNNKVNGRKSESSSKKSVVNESVVNESISRKTSNSSTYKIAAPKSSHFFLVSCYQQLLESKSMKRFPDIKDDVTRAYELVKVDNFTKERAMNPHNIDLILSPLIQCCNSGSQTLSIIALDGISKLISYEYLSNDLLPGDSDKKKRSPIEKAVLAVCSCFVGETTNEKIQTQVIKCLMSAVSSTEVPLHQEALLNAIRTLYNIFLLSHDINNQTIAQGTLLQMSRSIFSRIDFSERSKEGDTLKNLPKPPRSNSEVLNELTYDDDEDDNKRESLDYKLSEREKLSLEAIGGKAAEAAANAQVQGNIDDSVSDLNVLDAFLLFRALCKLSIKPFQSDGSSDHRCMSLRSKLLSLYLILVILHEYSDVFLKATVFFLNPGNSDTPRKIREEIFLKAVKPYFCLCLSRNLVSDLPKVYELTMAIFELVITKLRKHMKREVEVLLKEIIVPILEMKSHGSQHQKHILISIFLRRVCSDPQILVEIYLNYDCDQLSLKNNIFESIVGALSRLTTIPRSSQDFDEAGSFLWDEPESYYINTQSVNKMDLINLPPLTSDRFSGYFTAHSFFNRALFSDFILQHKSMDCLVNILKSLVQWSNRGLNLSEEEIEGGGIVANGKCKSPDSNTLNNDALSESETTTLSGQEKDIVSTLDDPSQFERIKNEKQILQKCVDLFNRKPKKGIESLVSNGIIASNNPNEIAIFLLQSSDLDKDMIGEYLGEVDNVAIMHCFVDQLDFTGLEFVAALRKYLKTFRLPGEAQKIDRFMLKFSERYVSQNPGVFHNADTSYVLAYSVIMLNTDLHNPQVKRRMKKEEFLKNNRGIDDGKDIAENILLGIYDQISKNEIMLKDIQQEEVETQTNFNPLSAASLASQFDILGAKKKLQKSSSTASSIRMQTNAEKYLKKMLSRKTYREDMGGMAIFYSASHFEHVRPMFEVSWMAFLAALSAPLKESDDEETINMCLEGFSYAIHVAGFFDLELARSALVTTLSNFSFLSDISEMKSKNIMAVKAILDIAVMDGNYLKKAWGDVLQVVNHLVRLQLVPNFSATTNGRDRSLVAHRDSQSRPYSNIALLEGNSQAMLISVDKVFASTVYLNGPAIVDFMKALCDISWKELKSIPNSFDPSKTKTSPKMFSIQKLVEVAYYNMSRIKLEWKEIWEVLEPLFNQVGSHRHDVVASFAIDSLRQLSMKFLEKRELPYFQFQKVFLQPFVHIIKNNPSLNIKDMVLQCINQMIKAHKPNLNSGWITILNVLSMASHDRAEPLVTQAFDMTQAILFTSFEDVICQPEIFANYLHCLTQFSKNSGYENIGLSAVETFKECCDRMIEYMENQDKSNLVLFKCSYNESVFAEVQEKFPQLNHWIPIFHYLMCIITEVLDLKIRTRALNLLFSYLHEFGGDFPDGFWHIILDSVIFPIFSNLGMVDRNISIKFTSKEDCYIWVSTTLAQALKKFVDLFTEYYDKVFKFLNGLLDLLSLCLCQANRGLVEIGSECLILLVEKNADRLQTEDWERLICIVLRLFQASSRVPKDVKNSASLTITDRSKTSKLLLMNCIVKSYKNLDNVLEKMQILESVSPLPLTPSTPTQQLNLSLNMILVVEDAFLQNDIVFQKLQTDHIFAILDIIERSYLESKELNTSFDLKGAIERQATSKLERFALTSLSLELNSLVCLAKVLLKMYTSDKEAYIAYKKDIEERLIPLCKDTFTQFNELSEYPLIPGFNEIFDLWHQVVLRIGNFLCVADGQDFVTIFSPSSAQILLTLKHRHLTHDIQSMLFNIMQRVDQLFIHSKLDSSKN